MCRDFVPILCLPDGSRPTGHSLARVLALALVLVAPVAGPVERGFDPGRPFEAGRHRGIDLAAAPGTPVRAACTGPVAFAGRIGAAGIVTLRCGPWRVTHMPLATIRVRGGAVSRGTAIGTVAASSGHAGLHLGVRRDGTRFGYVDPLRFIVGPHESGAARPRATRPTDRGAAARRATNRPLAARAHDRPRPRAASTGIVAVRPVARMGRAGARARRRGPSSARTYSNPVAGRRAR